MPSSSASRAVAGFINGLESAKVHYTAHANQRIAERCVLGADEVQSLLRGKKAIQLGSSSFEGRSYHLVFAPQADLFFVAVVSSSQLAETAWVITLLERQMYEKDRGPIAFRSLEAAARLTMSDAKLVHWFATVNVEDCELHTDDMAVNVAMKLGGLKRQVTLHPVRISGPFAGGRLDECATSAHFWRWMNQAFFKQIGGEQVVDDIEAIELTHRGRVVRRMPVTAGVRDVLRSQLVRRKDATLVVAFALDEQLHSVQRKAPASGLSDLQRHSARSLLQDTTFRSSIQELLAKVVPSERLEEAYAGVCEIQLLLSDGSTIDLVEEGDMPFRRKSLHRSPPGAEFFQVTGS